MHKDGLQPMVSSQKHLIWLIFEMPGEILKKAGTMTPQGGLRQLLRHVDGIFLVQWRGGEFQEVKELNFKQKRKKNG